MDCAGYGGVRAWVKMANDTLRQAQGERLIGCSVYPEPGEGRPGSACHLANKLVDLFVPLLFLGKLVDNLIFLDEAELPPRHFFQIDRVFFQFVDFLP